MHPNIRLLCKLLPTHAAVLKAALKGNTELAPRTTYKDLLEFFII